MFAGVQFCGSAQNLCLRELLLAIVKDWFFLLGSNFCDFQEAACNWNYNMYVFIFNYVLSTSQRKCRESVSLCHNYMILS